MHRWRIVVAVAISLVAFWLYHATLLPGFDFGDTGSFQATVGSSTITPRDGYPLYFAIGRAALWLSGAEPAHALNLVSAVEGAIACGLIVLAGAELAGSVWAGAAAALLFCASYTFWSQATIAEVYALHIVMTTATLLLLLWWQRQPSLGRLALFFAVYALGFGNHLSMILLLPGYAVFLLISAPGGWRSMLSRRVVALAVGFAVLGACQYMWNLTTLWYSPRPPRGFADAIATFWFDVTKSDWRETMVLHVPRAMLVDHLRMYSFDLRQQFGSVVPWLAAIGLVLLFRRDSRRGVLMLLLYIVNVVFAYSYNVGDTHVFYIPSHFCVALLVAPALACIGRIAPLPRLGTVLSLLAIAYAGLRMYGDYPALDRSGDLRPTEVLTALTNGLDDRRSILLADLNWQVHNGLAYFAKEVRPEVAYAYAPDVLLYAPVLIDDNRSIGRFVAVTERARRELTDAYGPLLRIADDGEAAAPTLSARLRDLPPGTRYVLCVLKPVREWAIDDADLASAVRILSGGAIDRMPAGDYAGIAGRIGEIPTLQIGADDPFRRATVVGGVPVELRMDSWLAADTIRRMGFGHVVAARRHTLIVERGVSFAAFDEDGRPLRVAYAAGIFAPQPRYRVTARAIVDP